MLGNYTGPIEMPGNDGRTRVWRFTRGGEEREVEIEPRIVVNDALTIHRLVVNGAGLGVISGYLCAPDVEAGRLVTVLPEWDPPPVDIHILFPSRREFSPAVRAFVDFMREAKALGRLWRIHEDEPDRLG